MEVGTEKIEIFFSYAREDQKLLHKLQKYLRPLKRAGLVTDWHDGDISAGKQRANEINKHLDMAHIILLLVSVDFIASDYCQGVEIKRAMERHEAGEARVIPVILRPVNWWGELFGRLQALPTGAVPVTKWRNREDAFLIIAEGIRKVVEELRTKLADVLPSPVAHTNSVVVYVAEDIQKAVGELPIKGTEASPSLAQQKEYTAADIDEGVPKAPGEIDLEDTVPPASSMPPNGYIVIEKRGLTMADNEKQQVGNYLVLRLLGQGSFAKVYLGEHIHLGTRAAIKILRTQLSEEDVRQFNTEARTIASLTHPNIVKVLEFGFTDNVPFLVMDFAPYGSVRYPKGTQLPPAAIIPYVNQVAAALQYAHDRGVIHRDVKPENMLIGRMNEVLLSDFGIAVELKTRSQKPQDIAGTVAYMAPEQFDNNPLQAGIDQYALGVVVYEWLSGECPFSGSFEAVAYQHIHTPPPSLRGKVPGISPEIEQVVMKALAKNPQQRFSSVKAFAEALEQAIAGTIIITPSEPTGGALGRRPFLVGIGLAGLVVGGAGGFLTRFLFPPTRVQAPQIIKIVTPTPSPLKLPHIFFGHVSEVNSVAWSPNGKLIASGSRDNTAKVWDVTTGENIFTYTQHNNWVNTVAWSLDGKRIASGSGDDTVQVWDATTGGSAITYKGHTASVQVLEWSPDGTLIASAGYDATVQVWNPTSGFIFVYKGHTAEVDALAWSPDGKLIASGGGKYQTINTQNTDTTVQVWAATTGHSVLTYKGHLAQVDDLAWSPDSRLIASASFDNTVRVWDVATGGQASTLIYRGHSNPVRAVAWSPDGKLIASASADHTVQVWNASIGNTLYTYRGHYNWVHTVAWSPDGKLIASGSADQTIQIWEVKK